MTKMTDHPFDSVVRQAQAEIAKGNWVCQKFTCSKCGNRLTINEANVFHSHGHCDACGHVTNVLATGCNFLLLVPGKRPLEELAALGTFKAPRGPGLTIAVTSNLHEDPPGKQ